MGNIVLEATRMIENCFICGRPIEVFEFYYLTGNGRPVHDYCWEEFFSD